MKLSLRVKLFVFVPVLALLPWLGYQTLQKLEVFATEAQTEALRVLAEPLRVELEALAPPIPRRGLTFTVEPLAQAPVLDGFVDDWPIGSAVLNDDRVGLRLGQYGASVYLVAEVRDATRFYSEPRFGRERATPFDGLLVRQVETPNADRVLLATEASGRFVVPFLETTVPMIPREPIAAYWWELAGGYRVEWQMPIVFFNRGAVELVVTDHNRTSPSQHTYRFQVQTFPVALQQLAVRLAGETRQIMVLDANRQVIAKTPPPDTIIPLQRLDGAGEVLAIETDTVTIEAPIQTEQGARYLVLIRSPKSVVIGGAQQALVSLGWQTLGVLVALIIGLSVFAGRLAERITRLRRELRSYLDGRGRLSQAPALSDTEASDEVGELARDVAQVLSDLQRYTLFLERIPRTLRHELSNPMSAIQTSLELLSDEQDPAQQARLRATAERGIQKLESTLAKVTEAASLEEALRDEEQRPFNVVTVIQNALHAMQLSVPDRQFVLDAPDAQVMILGNDLRFEQLLDKLFDNACDYTSPEGRIRVSIRNHITHADVMVENDGPQVSETASKDAFQMFTGTRNDSTGLHLGLGLYVVRVIAESMGAEVSMTNRARGVVVTVRGLPTA
jgi:signal transduction histidine kinase